MLREAGAIVYCSGRSRRGQLVTSNRPETIDETAELVTAVGGLGIPVETRPTVEPHVQTLFERVRRE